MKLHGTFLLFSLLFLACQAPEPIEPSDITHIIPQPQVTYPSGQKHRVDSEITWSIPKTFTLTKGFLEGFLSPHGFNLLQEDQNRPQWAFSIDTALAKGAYQLEIEKEHLSISAADDLGAFYAAQTLRQLMPEYLEAKPTGIFDKGFWGSESRSFYLPTGLIKDHPKFAYRGMHLDVGRHFFGPEQIKQYIDYLALLKMNYFHWHLTEDQGWRIEIKSFPRLTEHASTRPETLVGHYSE